MSRIAKLRGPFLPIAVLGPNLRGSGHLWDSDTNGLSRTGRFSVGIDTWTEVQNLDGVSLALDDINIYDVYSRIEGAPSVSNPPSADAWLRMDFTGLLTGHAALTATLSNMRATVHTSEVGTASSTSEV